MMCPGCAADMQRTEFHAIEIDRCPACGGISLDKGELEGITDLKLASVIEGGVVAAHVHRETIAHCHPCGRPMVALRGADDVEYDWCEGCERLFFDRGELTALDAYVAQ